MFRIIKFVFVWLIVAAITSVTIAFASSGTNVTPSRGEGASQIGGWTVSNIEYRFAADPLELAALEFDLDSSASTVMVKLIASDSQYHSCVNNEDYHWRCDFNPQVNLASIDEISVIAINN